DVGGIPEMVQDRKTGFLFASKNSDDLANKLDYVLSNPKLRREVADQGRRWGLYQWSQQTLYENTVRIYHSALEAMKTLR
ncbi:glycosyltransferase, partial [Salmonella enterica subsp. enterica serovar Typhimurium]|uniref:glycosyltransferase n=1 Tax=Salmonella enterica TaxID=28901 RepID=UPI0020A3E132